MNYKNQSQKTCLATVTSENFIPGTLCMLESFLTNNGWFDGDIVIICERLSETSTKLLQSSFPNIVICQMSAELTEKLDHLSASLPWIESRRPQFGSLEILKLHQFDQVIFCDSDLLFLDSIEPIITDPHALIACGDGCYFRGNWRRKFDFAEIAADQAGPNDLSQTFNSGFMILNPKLLRRELFHEAIAMLTVNRWKNDQSGHTDQMIFNLLFSQRQILVSPAYNYILSHREIIQKKTGLKLNQAKVLHFTGRAKPWLSMEFLQKIQQDPALIAAHAKWHDVYTSFA